MFRVKWIKGISRSLSCWIAGLLVFLLQMPSATAATQMYFVHNDHLGTPVKLTDSSQGVVWEADKKPFGETSTSGSVSEDSRFPGQYFDSESGTSYNYYRDYDPSLGRYIQSDPIGLQGGLNTYIYVEGNPVRYVDYLGLKMCAYKSDKGYHHRWVDFGGDTNRSYGAFPAQDGYDFSPAWSRQQILSPDQKKDEANDPATTKQCYDTTDEEDKQLEDWIRENYSLVDPSKNPRYIYGVQDCRSFVNKVNDQRKKLQSSSSGS